MNDEGKKLRERGRLAYPRDPSARKRLSQEICSTIEKQEPFANAGRVGIFFPQIWEVDLLSLWKKFPDKCLFPRTLPKTKQIEFYSVNSLSELSPGYGGIPAPNPKSATLYRDWAEKDLVLVPGLQFDPQGGRLGTGHGYYDRFLSQISSLRWGVCWQAQLSQRRLPQFENDVSMGAIFTEGGMVVIGESL